MVPVPTQQEVIDAVSEAFHGVAREDGVTLHEARVIDDYGSNDERAAARMLDTEKVWEDVPHADIEEYSEALSFLDPKGFRYYIPAYMIWAVREFGKTDSMSVNATVFHLTNLDGDFGFTRLDLLSEPQRTAVAMFLLYISMEHGDHNATESVRRFWRKFLPPERQI